MDAIAACPERVLLAMDFDGTLAPQSEAMDEVRPLPETLSALVALSRSLSHVAIITGRDVKDVVRLGELDVVEGLERLIVLGHLGVERWDAATGDFFVPPAQPAVEAAYLELADVLAAAGHPTMRVDRQGRAFVVDARHADDPEAALADVRGPVVELAHAHGLEVEVGPRNIKVRSARSDKGRALSALVDELGPSIVVCCGSDQTDVPAFEVLDDLRARGVAAIGVSSGESCRELHALADVSVAGPEGMAAWLGTVAAVIDHSPTW